MLLGRLTFGSLLVLVVAACSGVGSTASPGVARASPSGAESARATAQTIEVKLTDALKIEPVQVSIKAGQLVRFVVTNTGTTDHEFFLGDEAAQTSHGKEMTSMGGMAHDEPAGIGLKPGETKELTYLFAKAGAFLAGCHVNAHYEGGMKAAITVTE